MGSIENFKRELSPMESLRARNELQLELMRHFHETPEEWTGGTDAIIAAEIFAAEPEILTQYFVNMNDPVKVAEIIRHFEDLREDRMTLIH